MGIFFLKLLLDRIFQRCFVKNAMKTPSKNESFYVLNIILMLSILSHIVNYFSLLISSIKMKQTVLLSKFEWPRRLVNTTNRVSTAVSVPSRVLNFEFKNPRHSF